MTAERRGPSLSHIYEARLELRKHLVLETVLMERSYELPEESDFLDAPKAMAIGAGYAYTQLEKPETEDRWLHVFTVFFETRPRNHHMNENVVRETNEKIIKTALDWLGNDEPPEIDPSIDPYVVEELVAFIEGFTITRDYFAAQGYTSPSIMVESA